MTTGVLEALARAGAMLGDLAVADQSLGPLTTYRVGGSAALACTVRTRTDLERVAAAVAGSAVPVLVVGRGSNLLVADRGFAGVAVIVSEFAPDVDVDGTRVRAGASVFLPVLARRTVAAGLAGLEWAVGVPGSVGGGVRMNAGGHGSDMASSLDQVEICDLATGSWSWRPASTLGLRFRGSDLGDTELVVQADFQLAVGDRASSEAELDEVVRWRRQHQPGGQNAGSVFVNPVPGQLSAGQVIDELGLRGLRLGSAHVSDKHANFIQADEGGSSDDVFALMRLVRQRVLQERGIALRSEIRLVGFEGQGW